MSIKNNIVKAIFNWIITLLRELRDRYVGADHENVVVPTNKKTKKKWDKWLNGHLKEPKCT